MKAICKSLYLLLILTLLSCEEVVDLDLPAPSPRLVVEANLDFDFEQNSSQDFKIKLTQSASFYDEEIKPATQARIYIEHPTAGQIFFKEIENSGIYAPEFQIPSIEPDVLTTLHIKYNEENYEAYEYLITNETTPYIEQEKNTYFGTEYYEIKLNFQDLDTDPNSLNYYLIERRRNQEILELSILNNELTRGQILTSTYLDEDTKVNDSIQFRHYKISKSYYQYLNMILESMQNGGGPFQVPVGKIKGNVRNISNPNNPALGYFRITQKHALQHDVTDTF